MQSGVWCSFCSITSLVKKTGYPVSLGHVGIKPVRHFNGIPVSLLKKENVTCWFSTALHENLLNLLLRAGMKFRENRLENGQDYGKDNNKMFVWGDTLSWGRFFSFLLFLPQGYRFPTLPWEFSTLLHNELQPIGIIVGDAGFEPGTSAPEVWCATTSPEWAATSRLLHSEIVFWLCSVLRLKG